MDAECVIALQSVIVTIKENKMINNPHNIGYHARRFNLTLKEVLENEKLAEHVATVEDQVRFTEGWKQCDEELEQENMEELIKTLDELV